MLFIFCVNENKLPKCQFHWKEWCSKTANDSLSKTGNFKKKTFVKRMFFRRINGNWYMWAQAPTSYTLRMRTYLIEPSFLAWTFFFMWMKPLESVSNKIIMWIFINSKVRGHPPDALHNMQPNIMVSSVTWHKQILPSRFHLIQWLWMSSFV